MPLLLSALVLLITAATAILFVRHPWWLPVLASDHGAAVDHRFRIFFLLLGALFIVSQVLLAWFLWKYRSAAAERSQHITGNLRFEITCTAAMILLFAGLSSVGGLGGHRHPSSSSASSSSATFERTAAEPFTDATETETIEITGAQFQWYFRYPGPDGRFGATKPALVDAADANPLGLDRSDPAARDDIVASQLVIPKDREIHVVLRAQDVIHGFFVPALRVKQDAVPGQQITTPISSNRLGSYDIVCSQLCGLGHYRMQGILKVVSPEDYAAWLKAHAPERQP